MNVLYEAVMTLGRSIASVDAGRWLTRNIGFGDSGCAVGLVTMNCSSRKRLAPIYLGQIDGDDLIDYNPDVLRLAASALVRAVPQRGLPGAMEGARKLDATHGSNNCEHIRQALAGSTEFMDMQVLIVRVNDNGDLGTDGVRQWFSDALDLLAQELPTPERPVVPERVEGALVLR